MDRVILHCDCNSFFASVEAALNPYFRDVPMAVCGSEKDRHGIVLAKNEPAKKYGIQTAETVYSAKKKCPGLIIAEPHMSEYVRYSRMVNEIYKEYTDLVEPFGIDESWLDVTASRRIFGSGEEIAEIIRKRIREEIGITVSIGVSFNKVFAKLGSDYKKPDAITVISRENFKSIVYPLAVGELLFVGKSTVNTLKLYGIKTIGELAATDPAILERKLGKFATMISKYARGEDDSPVTQGSSDETKSIGNGYTFSRDLTRREECRIGIDFLSEEIGSKLRQKGLSCTTVALTIKDEFLVSIQRQRPIAKPTNIASEIADAAFEILFDEWQSRPIRMLTVTVSGLIPTTSVTTQLDFFGDSTDDNREKNRIKEKTVDIIRQKYGNDSIIRGSIIESDIGIRKK